MVKDAYFHCAGVLLRHFYLVLMIRDVFLEIDKVYLVLLVYISVVKRHILCMF